MTAQTTREVAAELAGVTAEKADVLALAAAHREQVNDLTTSLLLSRFDTQDKVLDGILREARRTNGRVTALEAKAAADIVRSEVIDETVIEHHEALAGRRDRIRFYLTCVTMLLAGTVGALVGRIS